jgi:hypothetical protein
MVPVSPYFMVFWGVLFAICSTTCSHFFCEKPSQCCHEGTALAEWSLSGRLLLEDSMNILAAITREEKKVKKQLAKLRHDLIGLQSAAKALGKSANRDLTTAKKRVLSAAARAKISRATKKRWAKLRAQAKKAVA